jgi:hypothetical protein
MTDETKRADFEKWVKRLLPSASLDRDPTYINSYVYIAWRTWDAAERHYRAATSATYKLVSEMVILLENGGGRKQFETMANDYFHTKPRRRSTGDKNYTGPAIRDCWEFWKAGIAFAAHSLATKAETCPNCGSRYNCVFTGTCGFNQHHPWHDDPWHSPAPAPQKEKR